MRWPCTLSVLKGWADATGFGVRTQPGIRLGYPVRPRHFGKRLSGFDASTWGLELTIEPTARRAFAERGPCRGLTGNHTVSMNRRQLEALLDELDSGDSGASKQRRAHDRRPYRHECIDMQIQRPDGGWSQVTVAGRNISQGGMSVLHAAFLYPGSACRVALPTSGGSVMVEGKVVRCRHIYKMLHEVGIIFKSSLDTKSVAKRDANTDSASIAGRVLYVDPAAGDRAQVRHMLAQSAMTLTVAGDVEEAGQAIRAGCDLILCDVTLVEATWEAVRSAVKSGAKLCPIIAVTSDASPATQAIIRRCRCGGVLSKPIDQDSLLRAIGGFLAVGSSSRERGEADEACESGGGGGEQRAVELIQQRLEDLQEAVDRQDAMTAAMLCLQIKAGGGASVAKLAETAAESLAATMDVKTSLTHLQPLMDECRKTLELSQ